MDKIIPDKITVFLANRDERRILHRWFRQQDPPIFSAGVLLKKFPYDVLRFKECYECDNRVLLNDYHYGIMENNKDENYTGRCKTCDTLVTYECNYDDDARIVLCRNAIAIGRYFKGWNRPFECPLIDDEEKILEQLEKQKLFVIMKHV